MTDYDKMLDIHNNPKEALKQLQQAQAENKRMVADLEEQTRLTEQAEAEVERLKAALERAYDGGGHLWTEGEALLERAEQAEARAKRREEALRQLRHHTLYSSVGRQILETALAEGDSDGELRPEVEARLRESLKTPREDLLTSDEMRQKLEDTDADPD